MALVAGLSFVFGGLAIGMASLLGPFAVIRYGMAMFGMQGGGTLRIMQSSPRPSPVWPAMHSPCWAKAFARWPAHSAAHW
ncbi:hypothetical protein MZE46_029335 [Pseudomonas sp. A4]|uniref:hypothetical protein n=1 Tax=Pseudomonas sp. S11A4 TaxID=1476791 RepID=UPI00215BE58E|nr:hypothetical protein [Pseudomonas sp. S11A4]MCR8935690.1 hypothetical protein [Pseudomonas sp. S11A4]